MGSPAFAYGGQLVQNEVAATVATPPAVLVSMRRALWVAFTGIAAFYFAISIGKRRQRWSCVCVCVCVCSVRAPQPVCRRPRPCRTMRLS